MQRAKEMGPGSLDDTGVQKCSVVVGVGWSLALPACLACLLLHHSPMRITRAVGMTLAQGVSLPALDVGILGPDLSRESCYTKQEN
jgi:hypothetical protein